MLRQDTAGGSVSSSDHARGDDGDAAAPIAAVPVAEETSSVNTADRTHDSTCPPDDRQHAVVSTVTSTTAPPLDFEQVRAVFGRAIRALQTAIDKRGAARDLEAGVYDLSDSDELSRRLQGFFNLITTLHLGFELGFEGCAASRMRDVVFVALSPYITTQDDIAAFFGALCECIRWCPLVFLNAEVRDGVFMKHAAGIAAVAALAVFTQALFLLSHVEEQLMFLDVFGVAEAVDNIFAPIATLAASSREHANCCAASSLVTVVEKLAACPCFRTQIACDNVVLPVGVALVSTQDDVRAWFDTVIAILANVNTRPFFATPRARHAFVRVAKHCRDDSGVKQWTLVLRRIVQGRDIGRRVFATKQVRDVFTGTARFLKTDEGVRKLFQAMKVLAEGPGGVGALFATEAVRDQVFIPLAAIATSDNTASVLFSALTAILSGEHTASLRDIFATAKVRDAVVCPLLALMGPDTAIVAYLMLLTFTWGNDDSSVARCRVFATVGIVQHLVRHVTPAALVSFLAVLQNIARVHIPGITCSSGMLNEFVRLAQMVPGNPEALLLFLRSLRSLARTNSLTVSVFATVSARDGLFLPLAAHVEDPEAVAFFCETVSVLHRAAQGSPGDSLFRHSSMHSALNRMAEHATTASAITALALLCDSIPQ